MNHMPQRQIVIAWIITVLLGLFDAGLVYLAIRLIVYFMKGEL